MHDAANLSDDVASNYKNHFTRHSTKRFLKTKSQQLLSIFELIRINKTVHDLMSLFDLNIMRHPISL